jgi:hypothetical protein
MVFTLLTGWLAEHVSYESVFIVGSGMIICAALFVVALVRVRDLKVVGSRLAEETI